MGPAPRLLVVDDERPIREMLELGLQSRGFEVRSVADGPAAIPVIKEWKPELILLDVMLPKIDGLSMLPVLRRLTEAPIVMLSAKGELDDRVQGLDRGADDYVAKPFEMSELVARLRSALRRPRLENVEVISTPASRSSSRRGRCAAAGACSIFRRSSTICWSHCCATRAVSSRASNSSIMVWGIDADVGPGSVERYISYLRAKVDDDTATRLIHTIRGVGLLAA